MGLLKQYIAKPLLLVKAEMSFACLPLFRLVSFVCIACCQPGWELGMGSSDAACCCCCVRRSSELQHICLPSVIFHHAIAFAFILASFYPTFSQFSSNLQPAFQHANLREDADGEDDHPRGRTLGQHRKRQSQDPRQRR